MKPSHLAATALLAAAPAFAAVTIDFESVVSFDPVGTQQGATFGPDALGLTNSDPTPFFSNAPSPVGVMTPVGPDSAMNLAIGFTGSVSFAYASTAAVIGGVQVWSGLSGGGSLLASFDLANNATAGGCSDSPYCHFDTLSQAFSGVAQSITFGNAVGSAAFDNLSITPVPEPATTALMALGLGALALAARRRRG